MKRKILFVIVGLTIFIALGAGIWIWQNSKESQEATKSSSEPESILGLKIAPFNPEDVIVDPETGLKIIKDTITILFAEGTSERDREEIVNSINGEVAGYRLFGDFGASIEVRIKNSPTVPDLKKIISELKANPKVTMATLNRVGTLIPHTTPDKGNDPMWGDTWDESSPSGKNWGLEAIYGPSAWEYNNSIKSPRVGIVDMGFKTDHEDLDIPQADTYLGSLKEIKELNLNITSSNDKDKCGKPSQDAIQNHGTHVAGIIGAVSDNDVGITGTIWDRDLFVYELNPKEYSLLDGVRWLLGNDTKIINLSYGFGPQCSSEEDIKEFQIYFNEELKRLSKLYGDFLIVQSAGNEEIDAERAVLFNPLLGKNYENLGNIVITVGALELNPSKLKSFFTGDWDKFLGDTGKYAIPDSSNYYSLAEFSNYGKLVDVVAPGKDIYSTLHSESRWNTTCFDWNSSYGCKSGTSMAAPFVTGVAGLVWGANPNLTAGQVKEIIVNSADRPITYKGKEYKILNAKNSVELALGENKKLAEQKNEEEIQSSNLQGQITNPISGAKAAQWKTIDKTLFSIKIPEDWEEISSKLEKYYLQVFKFEESGTGNFFRIGVDPVAVGGGQVDELWQVKVNDSGDGVIINTIEEMVYQDIFDDNKKLSMRGDGKLDITAAEEWSKGIRPITIKNHNYDFFFGNSKRETGVDTEIFKEILSSFRAKKDAALPVQPPPSIPEKIVRMTGDVWLVNNKEGAPPLGVIIGIGVADTDTSPRAWRSESDNPDLRRGGNATYLSERSKIADPFEKFPQSTRAIEVELPNGKKGWIVAEWSYKGNSMVLAEIISSANSTKPALPEPIFPDMEGRWSGSWVDGETTGQFEINLEKGWWLYGQGSDTTETGPESFTISGSLFGNKIFFYKNYTNRQIYYEGTINGNSTSGKWKYSWSSGTWSMVRK